MWTQVKSKPRQVWNFFHFTIKFQLPDPDTSFQLLRAKNIYAQNEALFETGLETLCASRLHACVCEIFKLILVRY